MENKTSTITIFNSNKSTFAAFPILSINNIEEAPDNAINIHIMSKKEKKSFSFFFADVIHRYLFKTLFYNNLVNYFT